MFAAFSKLTIDRKTRSILFQKSLFFLLFCYEQRKKKKNRSRSTTARHWRLTGSGVINTGNNSIDIKPTLNIFDLTFSLPPHYLPWSGSERAPPGADVWQEGRQAGLIAALKTFKSRASDRELNIVKRALLLLTSGASNTRGADFIKMFHCSEDITTDRHSSGAVWESRWPSWPVRPNEPSGFRGRKAILNHASALVTACP